ncbi:MAG: InlB B-repeat-containing protein, partial [Mycoplasmatales bacterium]
VPTKTGYTFNGWNTAVDGKGKTWNFATDKMPAKNITLYAQWSINKYKVMFNINDGTQIKAEEVEIEYGSKIPMPKIPQRENYDFVGWNLKADGTGTTWNFSTDLMPANNIILYALWDNSTFDVHFNTNGGLGRIEGQKVKHGSKISEPITPDRKGYTFVNWNTKADGSGKVFDFATDVMQTTDLTLYAIWLPIKYQVVFEANSGTGIVPEMQEVSFEGLIKNPESKLEKEGYSLIGWNTSSDGTGTTWDFENSKMPSTNITLYAMWSINSYKLIHYVDGEIYDLQIIKYGEKAKKPKEPVKIGHTFTGWILKTVRSSWTHENETMPANDLNLHASFTVNSYTVTFDVDGELTNIITDYNSLISEPKAPEKKGYKFEGWFQENGAKWNFALDKTPANNIKLIAKFSEVTSSEVDPSDDSSNNNNNNNNTVEPVNPEKDDEFSKILETGTMQKSILLVLIITLILLISLVIRRKKIL